jgi:hypothetical protein
MSDRDVAERLRSGLTVGQLREALDELDADAPVLLVCDYGDYHHTQQAIPIQSLEVLTSDNIYESAYSHSGLALGDQDEDYEHWCPKCEIERAAVRCPKCGSACLDEEGNAACQDGVDSSDVIILKG